MLDANDIAETLNAALQHGVRYDWPFPLTQYKPFSAPLYAEMIAQLPADEFYEPLPHKDALRPDGTSTRLIMSLSDDGTKRLPAEQRDFWRAFNASMRSDAVRDVFMRHLEPHIIARFGGTLSEIPCYPTARLGRDADGYRIGPHPDAENRVYTAQVYLADDESQTEVGTTVYDRQPDGTFTFVRRLPFVPNTGFCFARTDNTFHGVETVALKKPRNNLHISGFNAVTGF